MQNKTDKGTLLVSKSLPVVNSNSVNRLFSAKKANGYVETSKINEVEAKITNLLKYIHNVIGSARNTPIAAKQEAGNILYNTTHVYLHTHKLPQQQMLETVNGMLTDLASSKLEAHIKTLNLETEVETLTLLHAQLTVLLDSRAEVQMVISEENSKIVRQDMDELFEMMMAIIWAYSLTNPSEEITSFIKSINKVLFDTETAYNQRIAQRGKKDEEENYSTDVEDNSLTEEEVEHLFEIINMLRDKGVGIIYIYYGY